MRTSALAILAQAHGSAKLTVLASKLDAALDADVVASAAGRAALAIALSDF